MPTPTPAKSLARTVEDAFEAEQVPFLARLVEIPSHTYAPADVEVAYRPYDEAMVDLGFTVEKFPDPSGRFADHRVYSSPAALAGERAVALVGHMDTVFPRDMGFVDFRREDDTIYGPGTLDMKSGLTAILFALRAWRAHDANAFAACPVRVFVVSDEEVGSPSSRTVFDAHHAGLRCAMVFEAGRTEDKIVTARKGAAAYDIVARGRAAHAGLRHEEGINAILGLTYVIQAAEALTDYARGVTVNCGLIKGGTAKNTVPDTARCTFDTRFERLEDAAWVKAELEALCQKGVPQGVLPERLHEVTFVLEPGASRPPMEADARSQALRAVYERHAAPAGLKVGEAPLQGGGSDANLLSALGVPSIDGLGPWGMHFHKPEEHSSLASLQKRTVALAAALADPALYAL